jgi:bacterioferritin-associated ferredoxin
MKVTEADLIAVIVEQGIADLRRLRHETGAGDGCMACRRRLQRYLDEHAGRSLERVTAVALELV